MTGETMPDPDGLLPVGLEAARARAWAEDQRRCGDNEPYTDGVTAEALIERVEGQHRTHSRPRQSGQDYAFAVSSDEGPPSVDGSLDDADSDGGRQLSWVAALPECDRRLFAEELSRRWGAPRSAHKRRWCRRCVVSGFSHSSAEVPSASEMETAVSAVIPVFASRISDTAGTG